MSNTSLSELPQGMTIITPDQSGYHYARQISNTRFGAQPAYIAYCKNATHVADCLQWCQKNGVPFRIRSGGHQHEGMSSGNHVLIIDLSEMNAVTYLDEQGKELEPPIFQEKKPLEETCSEAKSAQYATAWIGAGKQLGLLYTELEQICKIIPGGGCSTVNLGGLVQGGGWGVSIRKYGLTCDQLLACEVVMADGSIKKVSKEKDADLFWAIKGGGGGNWGVIAKYHFKLCALSTGQK
jgi:FAD/FMN-containing dehydrogenase